MPHSFSTMTITKVMTYCNMKIIFSIFFCLAFCKFKLLSLCLYYLIWTLNLFYNVIVHFPQEHLYALYTLLNKFVRRILCSKVVLQRTNSVLFLNTIFPRHYKNPFESILATKWFGMVSILSI